MKINLKTIILSVAAGASLTSCESFLDREPITSITPDTYFYDAEQVGSYVIAKYDWLVDTKGNLMAHPQNYRAGIQINDDNTDNYFSNNGNQNYFAGRWESSAGQVIGDHANKIRTWNYLIERVTKSVEEKTIHGDIAMATHYLGEAYFFRALAYYNALVNYGDFPIVTKVLKDDRKELVEFSKRAPRNEVARQILSDLDKAISMLKDKGFKKNLRINKQVAQLFKSRVALFEATFERYHKGSGRVPGDANWPGAKANAGKSFNIEGEIVFFLDEAMKASKEVADKCTLTENNHKINPKFGDKYVGNPYFDMFCTPDLSSNDEVLFWKEYNRGLGVVHDAAYLLTAGGDVSGVTRGFINAYLMKNGLPIYAAQSGYNGDADLIKEAEGRDERMQLFVYNPGTVLFSDPNFPRMKGQKDVVRLDTLRIVSASREVLDRTGYRPRKYVSYDFDQQIGNQVVCYTGCPIFRAAEAYLNYIEACYEKNHSLDATADKYWKAIRTRAGVDPDYNKTINATDLDKEVNIVNESTGKVVLGDLAVYSGDKKVDKTLYNIRRERRCEFIGEGRRWDDLVRWRSWDLLLTCKYQPEGINIWAKEFKKFVDKKGQSTLIYDKENANVSSPKLSTYLRPLSFERKNNPLFDGYTWKKAYYLSPLGTEDLTQTASDPNDPATSISYQNPFWNVKPGKAIE